MYNFITDIGPNMIVFGRAKNLILFGLTLRNPNYATITIAPLCIRQHLGTTIIPLYKESDDRFYPFPIKRSIEGRTNFFRKKYKVTFPLQDRPCLHICLGSSERCEVM